MPITQYKQPVVFRPVMADWRCSRCGHLLLRRGPGIMRVEVKCAGCHTICILDEGAFDKRV